MDTGHHKFNPDEFAAAAGGVPIYANAEILLGTIGISNPDENSDEAYGIESAEKAGYRSDIPK